MTTGRAGHTSAECLLLRQRVSMHRRVNSDPMEMPGRGTSLEASGAVTPSLLPAAPLAYHLLLLLASIGIGHIPAIDAVSAGRLLVRHVILELIGLQDAPASGHQSGPIVQRLAGSDMDPQWPARWIIGALVLTSHSLSPVSSSGGNTPRCWARARTSAGRTTFPWRPSQLASRRHRIHDAMRERDTCAGRFAHPSRRQPAMVV